MRLKEEEKESIAAVAAAGSFQNDAQQITSNYNDDDDNVIYPVTEGIKSVYTRYSYKNSFNRFLKHIKVTDLQVFIDFGPKALEQLIIKYIIYDRDVKKLSRSSIQSECNAISHFCEMNDIILNKKKIKRFLPSDESSHDDRLYTPEELERIIVECTKRDKVIILRMVSAGIRIGGISKLKVKDLELLTIQSYDTYKITVAGDSKHDRYWTCCTIECVTAIKEYLEQRKQQGEGPVVKETSPLIREHCDAKDIFREERLRILRKNTENRWQRQQHT